MSDNDQKSVAGSRDDSSRPVVSTATNPQEASASHTQTLMPTTQKRKRTEEVEAQIVYAGGAEENLSIRMPLITRDQNPVAVVSASTVQGMGNQQPALTEVMPVTGAAARRVIRLAGHRPQVVVHLRLALWWTSQQSRVVLPTECWRPHIGCCHMAISMSNLLPTWTGSAPMPASS